MVHNKYLLFVITAILIFTGCQADNEPTVTTSPVSPTSIGAEAAANRPEPTATSSPTMTATLPPEPTETATAVPSDTPHPTETAAAARLVASATPSKPLATSTPDKSRPAAALTPVNSSPEESSEPNNETETALAILEQAEVHAQDLESMSYLANLSMDLSDPTSATTTTIGLQMACQADIQAQNSYCQMDVSMDFGLEGMEPIETATEFVIRDGESWLREDGGAWQLQPGADSGAAGLSPNEFTLSEMLPFLQAAGMAGETVIDNVPVVEIILEVDMLGLLDLMGGVPIDTLNNVDFEPALIHYWIGKEDYLTRKMSLRMGFASEEVGLTLGMQMAMRDFNEPVEIPDPTIASNNGGEGK